MEPDLEQNSQLDNNRPGPVLVSLRRFRADLDIVPSTAWRWIQRGWLDEPLNVGGRKYLTAEMVQRFKERAARGEFAGGVNPPVRLSLTDRTEGRPI